MGKNHLGSTVFARFSFSLLSLFVLVHSKSIEVEAMLALQLSFNASSSLGWADPDHCKWPHVTCSSRSGRVNRIQIGHKNLTGFLHPSVAQLTRLQTLDLSSNNISGPLPILTGLKLLQNLSLSNNNFSFIPTDFFFDLTSLERVYLDNNPFSPRSIPDTLRSASKLKVFSANAASFRGEIPDFFGGDTFARLTTLHLPFNNLEGGLPATFSGSSIQSLRLNGQQSSNKLNSPIAVIQNMTQLTEVWLDSNSFSGTLPDISRLTGLQNFSVWGNGITGHVPASFFNLPSLKVVNLTNNLLQGPTPSFGSSVIVDMKIGSNSFCLPDPGVACDPRVNTLLLIAQSVGYPTVFAKNWIGNDPCNAWSGLHCVNGNIIVANFSNLGLTGTISPNFSSIISLQILILANNNLTGTIPNELTTLPNLGELDVSNNRLSGKVPPFKSTVLVNTDGNPNIGKDSGSSGNRFSTGMIVGLVIGGVCVVLFVGILIYWLYRGKQKRFGDLHDIEVGRMVISIHVLKNATNNFSQENILGRGGFGTVYKGGLHDGTKIAVKRMESGVVNERGWDQFKSEIVVLNKVRHRHLVSLLGYCLNGDVYTIIVDLIL